jgi:hypothetical protein
MDLTFILTADADPKYERLINLVAPIPLPLLLLQYLPGLSLILEVLLAATEGTIPTLH